MSKKPIEYYQNKIDNIFGKNEYVIKGEIINVSTPVSIYRTKCGHTFNKRIKDFCPSAKGKNLCSECTDTLGRKKPSKRTHEEYLLNISKNSPELEIILDKGETITRDKQKIKTKCIYCGEITFRRVSHLIEGTRCPCTPTKNQQEHYDLMKKDEDTFLKEMEKIDYLIPLMKYESCHEKLMFKCTKCGRTFQATPNNITSKVKMRCVCQSKNHISREETEFANFIKEVIGNKYTILLNDKSLLGNFEIDIYIPELKIAFEYNGVYYHSENLLDFRLIKNPYINGRNYHLYKTEKCAEKGVQLIHIFSTDWNNKKDIIKRRISYLLKQSFDLPKINARDCFVKEIDTKRKNKFLNKYHIQGEDNSSIRLGLYYKTKKNKIRLVSVMTFSKARNITGKGKLQSYDYELIRFASNTNYIVNGAFGKLFKYFKDNFEWKNLYTYADRTWSNGEIYKNNGWKLNNISEPGYSYLVGNKLQHRFNFTKGKLKQIAKTPSNKYYNKINPVYSDSKSEVKIMNEAGFYRIFNCGQMVFVYNR